MNNHPQIAGIPVLLGFHGVEHVVISPGSRNALLSTLLGRFSGIKTYVVPDERSAGNIALGMAQSLSKPVACLCTSGSAVQQYGGAVSEAFYQQVPLIILSADRPDEWIDQNDGQTIRQRGVFGNHLKGTFQLPVDTAHPDAAHYFIRQINEALLLAKKRPMGPVHINIPIREPFYDFLVKEIDLKPLPKVIQQVDSSKTPEFTDRHIETWLTSRRKMWVPGQDLSETWRNNDAEKRHSELIILTDPLSNCTVSHRITKHDSFLSAIKPGDEQGPDLLITTGKTIISKALKKFLRSNKPKHHWHFGEWDYISDPYQSVTTLFPVHFLEVLSQLPESPNEETYQRFWHDLDEKTKVYYSNNIQHSGELHSVYEVLKSLESETVLHVANSMAIRYVSMINPIKPFELYCNRGTSGLDTSNGTAVGHAIANRKKNILLTGDMAFHYDLNAFWHEDIDYNLDIIVINNQGGGIFDLIDGPEKASDGRPFLFAGHSRSIARAAGLIGFRHILCSTIDELRVGLNEIKRTKTGKILLEYQSKSENNRNLHQQFKTELRKFLS